MSHPRPSFRRVLMAQLALAGVGYLVALAAFALGTKAITDRFTELASGPYLATSLLTQARMVPAYALMALVAAVLSRPWLREESWRSFLPRLLAVDAALMLCALGPALLASPGSFDAVARALPFLNLFALQQLGALHLVTGLFLALTAWGLAFALPSARARWLTGVLVVGMLSASLVTRGAPPRATALAHRNVLILAADSWRFDRLGVHGAARADLTPHLDAFAKTSVDFTSHHVSTASTLESWVTFFTGLYPPHHGIRSMYPSKAEVSAVEQRPELLPRLLREAGYSTFVSSDWAGNCFDLVDLGFEHRRVSRVQNFEALLEEASVRAHPLVPLFFARLPGIAGDALVPGRSSLASGARPTYLVDQLFSDIDVSIDERRPFLGLLFVSPTHLPYNARAPFNAKYVDPSYDGINRYHVEVSAHELITTGFAPTLSPAAVQHVRDLYDGAVSDFDDTVGVVLARLEERGLLDETVVIVTSDHGEDLYEAGSTVGHGTNFFGGEQSTRIPLLVRAPGLAPRVVKGLTRTADLTPTLLELLGLTIPAGLDGVSLLPLARGAVESLGLTAFAETCYLFFPKAKAMLSLSDAERADVVDLAGAADTLEVDASFRHNLVLREAFRQRVIDAKDLMVRDERWKLIEIPGKRGPIRRLYDLENDPHQQQNLAGLGRPEEGVLAERLRATWR